MIKNYLITAWRSIKANAAYSAINILGLSAGLSSFVILLLYLNFELSYDTWSPELKKVFKVSMQKNDDYLQQTPAPLAQFLLQKYPDVAAATAVTSSGDIDILVSANGKQLYQKNFVTSDASFLKVFPYKLLKGNPLTALSQPKAVIITNDLAHKLFGNDDPMGKPLKVFNAIDGFITGVMDEPAGPSHLKAGLVMADPFGASNMHWENYSYQTYIKVKHPEPEAQIENEINTLFYNDHLKNDGRSYKEYAKQTQRTSLYIDGVSHIHNFPKHGTSRFTTVTLLVALAILLLLAGAINFSNLTVAKSMARAKEVGVRKVLGSTRRQLVSHFMTETVLQCLISLAISITVVYLALPYINKSFEISLSFSQQKNLLPVAIQILFCLLAIVIVSGLYPSMFLSGFNTSKVLKGNYSTGKKGVLFRNSLIMVQFMVSVFFILATVVISRQMDFMQSKDKGFNGEQVMRIQGSQKTRENDFDKVQQILMTIPGVASVTKTTKVPGDNLFLDTSTINFKHDGKGYRMSSVKVSKDYLKQLDVKLLEGRWFTDAYADQNTQTAIINETALRKLHLPNVSGQTITFPYCDSISVQIVGVVKDFNVQGFDSEIQPEVFTIGNKACMYQTGGAILVKLNSNHTGQVTAAIEKAWKNIEPGAPLRYSFLDQNFQQLFVSYLRLEKIITFFAVVAIVISLIGLFALTSFFTRQRVKEIGIRKVLGASVIQLAAFLSKEFIYVVLLAVLIITPVAWWFMQKWLQTFVYRIDLSLWLFAMGSFLAILIALITVSTQSIKAATANPVNSLRNE